MIRCTTCEHQDSRMCTYPGIGKTIFKQRGLDPLCIVRTGRFQPEWCPLGKYEAPRLDAEQSEAFIKHAAAPSPFTGEEKVVRMLATMGRDELLAEVRHLREQRDGLQRRGTELLERARAAEGELVAAPPRVEELEAGPCVLCVPSLAQVAKLSARCDALRAQLHDAGPLVEWLHSEMACDDWWDRRPEWLKALEAADEADTT